jgi:hypothetical protein
MKNFYSSLLKSMPPASKPRRSRTPLRVALLIILGFFVALPIFIIVTRALPKEGIGQVFYWIHDHIFLPIKGYTYTLFYPYSISWWGMFLTVLVVWVTAYLLMTSFTRDPHIYVLRRVVRRNVRHRILIKTSKWLKKWRLHPVLLKAVTDMERKNALNRLAAVPLTDVDNSICKRVVRLTQLYINLVTLPPAIGDAVYLEAVECWYEAYLQLCIRYQKNPGSETLRTLVTDLAGNLEAIVLPLLNFKDSEVLKDTSEKKAGFDVATVVLDLLFLASLYNNSLATQVLGTSIASNPEGIRRAVTTRLGTLVAQRRSLMDEIRIRLEKGDPDTEIELLEVYKDYKTSTISAAARLALSTALNLSALVDQVSMGLGYMESLEILDFVLNSLEVEDPRAEAVQPLICFPRPVHYRLCAELLELEIKTYEETWQKSVLSEPGNDLITSTDFELARTRVRVLYHAAGPDLDPAARGAAEDPSDHLKGFLTRVN